MKTFRSRCWQLSDGHLKIIHYLFTFEKLYFTTYTRFFYWKPIFFFSFTSTNWHTWILSFRHVVRVEFVVAKEALEAFDADGSLHHVGDEHGQHWEGEAQNVEQRQSNERLLRVQNVRIVRHDVDGKCCERHLVREPRTNWIAKQNCTIKGLLKKYM